MKKLLFSLFFITLFFILSLAQNNADDIVYICTGHYAQCYHSDSICKGLNTCNGDIIAIPLDKASKNHRPCKICIHKKQRSRVKSKKQKHIIHRSREPLSPPLPLPEHYIVY